MATSINQITELLNQAGELLQPFTRSVLPGSLVYDGTRYAPAAPQTPDPYALAWWSSIQTAVALLDGLESLTTRQLDYLRTSFCGGMGSFTDFSLEASRWGDDAVSTNARLSAIRSSLFHTLEDITPTPPNNAL